MNKIVSVKFKSYGKIIECRCGAFVLNKGDHVIVEQEEGLSIGIVTAPPFERADDQKTENLKTIFRIATKADMAQLEKNAEAEKQAFDYCRKCISDLGLIMNLFQVESTFDSSKLTFFFTAEGRVDFRQLVKLLVKQFRVRIEMRQVGVRNQAKMCEGIGRCGRRVCCSAFLQKFEPVSIRMAKEQNLSLNPTKISGLCGRLMCCLTYENTTYIDLRKQFPKLGKTVEIEDGKGRVIRHNIVGNRFTVRMDSGAEIEVNLDEFKKQKS